jgi:integrase
MSVYKPAKSPYWHYDFVIEGQRLRGSTGQASRRDAESYERKKRREFANGTLGQIASITLDEAAGRWWREKGIDRGDAADVERRITRLLQLLGKDTLLGGIGQVEVAAAIEVRRRQTRTRSNKKGARVYKVAAATVNRDIIETLRPILKRAKTHWSPKGAPHGLPEIDWTELRLKEPRGLSRIYTPLERARWIEEAEAEGVGLAVEMILTYGLRFGELLFHPDAFVDDPDDPILLLQKGRKRDVLLPVALRMDHARAIAARVARARAAGLDCIWYREGPKRLSPMTYAMLEGAISRAADRAEIKGARRIHGARHHAANAVLRRSGGDVLAVKGLLGHASIQSSQRYLTMHTSEMRRLLEDEIPRNSPELQNSEPGKTITG